MELSEPPKQLAGVAVAVALMAAGAVIVKVVAVRVVPPENDTVTV